MIQHAGIRGHSAARPARGRLPGPRLGRVARRRRDARGGPRPAPRAPAGRAARRTQGRPRRPARGPAAHRPPLRRVATRGRGHAGRRRGRGDHVRRHAGLRLPARRDRSALDGRRRRLRQPVPRHRARRRHHRPQRRRPTRRSSRTTSSATRTTAPRGRTSAARSRSRCSTATSSSGIVNFEGTEERPIGPAHVAVAEMLALQIAGALRSARLDEERRQRLHAIERVLEVSRGLAADLDRRRVVASVVDAARDLLDADAVEFASRGADGTYRVEHALGVAGQGRVGHAIEPGDGLVGIGHPRRSAGRVDRRRREPVGQPVGLGLPIHLDGAPSAVLAATRDRVRPAVQRARAADRRPAGHADRGRAAQRRAACPGERGRRPRSADGPAQPPLLRRGGRDGLRRRGPERSRAEPHRPRPRPLLRGQQRPRPRGRRRRAATRRPGDGRGRSGPATSSPATAARSSSSSRRAPPATSAVAARRARSAPPSRPRPAGRSTASTIPLTISAGVASRLGDEADGRALFRAADSALLAAKRAGRDRVVSV